MSEEAGSPVVIIRHERVAAPVPSPELRVPLSNLDLVTAFLRAGTVMCYEMPREWTSTSGEEEEEEAPFASAAAATLKRSLAQLLVTYYPFAGEVVVNAHGEPELLCNNRGVGFAEARADFGLGDLPLGDGDAGWGRMLPAMWDDRGVLGVQVTELRCGRLVIGILFDHRFADTYSITTFITAWREVAHGRPLPFSPHFHRSLLSPRKPLQYDSSIDKFFTGVGKSTTNGVEPATRHLARRFYYMSAEGASELQALASGAGGRRVSKFEAFTAYIWKMLGGEKAFHGKKACSMGMAVGGRPWLGGGGGGGGKRGAATTMAAGYVGNVVSFSCGDLIDVEELRAADLSELVGVLRKDLQDLTTEEHFLSLVDWVEARRPEAAAARICSEVVEDGASLLMLWAQHVADLAVDFGWGTPSFGSVCYSSHFVRSSVIMPMPSLSREGDWIVLVEMDRGQYGVFDAKLGSVLHPLTIDYFGSAGSSSRILGQPRPKL